MYAKIKIINLPKQPEHKILKDMFFILGRGSNADIVFKKDTSVSRMHCKVFYKNKHFWIEDLGSRNHTLVNNKIIKKHILHDEDYIQVGHNKILFSIIKSHEKIKKDPNGESESVVKRKDKLLGKIAVKLGILRQEELIACIKQQKKISTEGYYYKLEKIFLKERYLTKADLKIIKNYKNQISFKIPEYKLYELIAIGGMGQIYKAKNIKTNELVACKIFDKNDKLFQQQIEEQFWREADTLLKLDHINIVKGIDKGSINNIIYIIMEYIEGVTLKEYVKENGECLLPEECLNIILQLTKALNHFHEKGIVHQDIKAENILCNKNKIVKLCDFGLVKDTTLAFQEKNKFGTIVYMSPEQFKGSQNIDIRSDIYSLGVVFYKILFGKLPFIGTNEEIRLQHIHQPVIFPEYNKNAQKIKLADIIKKMMAKNPADRYQMPKELLADLQLQKRKFRQEKLGATLEMPKMARHRKSVDFYKARRLENKRTLQIIMVVFSIFMVLCFIYEMVIRRLIGLT